jgi:Putative transposase/Transposase zinc-binding domain
MSRPPLEVADLVRAAGGAFIERSRQWIRWKHVKVLLAIAQCRTAALGGHLDECTRCGHRAISYNSCRNRHCPKCQAGARERWLAARQKELLPTPYVHVVFTLPRPLAPLVLQNKKLLYNLLFRTSAETLLEVARDPRHLGAEIGFFSVLHTWSQKLELHPHVHCLVPAGGLSADHTRWIKPRYDFFLPVQVLGAVFRGKFHQALQRAFQDGQLNFQGDLKLLAQPKTFAAWRRALFRKDWVVYSKPPFGGPEHVLRYLGRYTHRVAISNHRLVSFADGTVTFRWRDSAHHNEQKLLSLPVDEFLRRFLLHLLPQGFVRIRNFGFLANRRRAATLPLCFQLLGSAQAKPEVTTATSSDTWPCPKCGGPMLVIERLTAAEVQLRSPPARNAVAA